MDGDQVLHKTRISCHNKALQSIFKEHEKKTPSKKWDLGICKVLCLGIVWLKLRIMP